LNTKQLDAVLRKRLPDEFRGVYSSDLLPPDCGRLPWCIILNTDCSHGQGIHWQCWFKSSQGVIHHFCSYGSHPKKLKWIEYLQANSRNGHWVMQRRRIQSEFSPFCGHYCLYYLLVRCRTPLDITDYAIMLDVNDSNILQKLYKLLTK